MAMSQIYSIGLPTSNPEQEIKDDSQHTMLSAMNIRGDIEVGLNKTDMNTQAANKTDDFQLTKAEMQYKPADVDQNGGTANSNTDLNVNNDLLKPPKSTKRGRPKRSIKPKEGVSESNEPILAMDVYAETRESIVQPMEMDQSEVTKEDAGVINTSVHQSEMVIGNTNYNIAFPEENAARWLGGLPKSAVEFSTGNHDATKTQDDFQPSVLDMHEAGMTGTDHIVNSHGIVTDSTENAHELKGTLVTGSGRSSKSKRKEGTEQGVGILEIRGKASKSPGRPPKSARKDGMSEIHDSTGKTIRGPGRPSGTLIKDAIGTQNIDNFQAMTVLEGNADNSQVMTVLEGNAGIGETSLHVTSSVGKTMRGPGRPPKIASNDVIDHHDATEAQGKSQAMNRNALEESTYINGISGHVTPDGKPVKRARRPAKSATKDGTAKETHGRRPAGVNLAPVGKTARRPGRPPKSAMKDRSKETQDISPSRSAMNGGSKKREDNSQATVNQEITEVGEHLNTPVPRADGGYDIPARSVTKDGTGLPEGKETMDNSQAMITQEDSPGINKISVHVTPGGKTNRRPGRPPKSTMKDGTAVLDGLETQNINSQPMMPQETSENVNSVAKVNRGPGRPPKSAMKDGGGMIEGKDLIQECSGRIDEVTNLPSSFGKTKKGPSKSRKSAIKGTQDKSQIVESLETSALVVHELRTLEGSITGALGGSPELKGKNGKSSRRPQKISKSVKTVETVEAQLCLNADGTATGVGPLVSLSEAEKERVNYLPGQESYSASLSKTVNSHVFPDATSSGHERGTERSAQSKKKGRPRRVSECGFDMNNSQLDAKTMQDNSELTSEGLFRIKKHSNYMDKDAAKIDGSGNSNGEGMPPKSTTRGRPKGSVNKINGVASTCRALVLHKVLNRLVAKKKSKKCEVGQPKSHSDDVVVNNDDSVDNDEHGSAGEEEECDDETLEAEGPVLDDVSGPDMNEFNDSVPPEWKSGQHLDTEPDGTFKILPSFSGESGPDLGYLPQEFCEFHLFLNLFPLDLIDHIINETNLYAEKEQYKSNIQDWMPLDRHSFLRFLGLALAMSLQFMGSEKYYWRNDVRGAVKYPDYGQLMSFTNFQQIKRFLHLKDNALRPPKGCREHKLWQLLEFEKRLNHTFRKAYRLGQSVTVGERIIPSNNKWNPCRVYNPRRPHKFGTQVWNLCDSSSGYNFSFRIHDRMPCKDIPFSVVTNLVKDLPSRGHQVYFDSRFTSIKLLKHLRNEGHGGTGTYVNINKHFPLLCQGKQPRGSSKFAYCYEQGLVACSWVDGKEMYFASNCLGMKKGEVRRLTSDGQETKIPCPEIVIKYFENKSGCDIFDHMILERGSSLQTAMSGFKWWHSVFWGLLDSVFTNCWILWKEIHHGKDISKFEFMVNLQEQLVHNSFKPYIPMIPLVQDIYHGHFLTRLNMNANRFCVVCSAIRKQQISEGEDVGGSQRTRTIWGCGKCMKTMCADPCFKLYHEHSFAVDSPFDGRPKVRKRRVPTIDAQE